MKITLTDPANRVWQLLHRKTPGGELIRLELRNYRRGEIFTEGCDGTHDLLMIRSRTFRRWDKPDEHHLITLRWRRRKNTMILHSWDKESCTILLAPALSDKWMPTATSKWSFVKDLDFNFEAQP